MRRKWLINGFIYESGSVVEGAPGREVLLGLFVDEEAGGVDEGCTGQHYFVASEFGRLHGHLQSPRKFLSGLDVGLYCVYRISDKMISDPCKSSGSKKIAKASLFSFILAKIPNKCFIAPIIKEAAQGLSNCSTPVPPEDIPESI